MTELFATQSISGRKGQAAMEFLMTYGWAILAAVIVIGVLASFGVFSSSNYIPTQCTLSAPFGCDGNQVAAVDLLPNPGTGGNIQLVLRNGGGQTYNITDITITGCGSYTTPFTMVDQNVTLVTVDCTTLLNGRSGEKFTGDVTLTYFTTGGVLDQRSSGSVTVEIE